jgi:hypothetical protein
VEGFDPESSDASFVATLLCIGYASLDEITAELLASEPTPAKTFYRMWTRTSSIESLPWRSDAREPPVEWNFMMSPQAFAQSGANEDVFARTKRQTSAPGPSPDLERSLATQVRWMPDISQSVDPFAPSYIEGLAVPLGQLMFWLQQFFVREDMDFFHPNDTEFIARQNAPERSSPFAVNIKAMFFQTDVITLVVSGVTGMAVEFDSFVDKLQQMIAEIPSTADQ